MPELKHIRVREAKARDIGLFKKLWLELLEEQAGKGSIIRPTEKTLTFYEALFDAYVSGRFDGIVLFVADSGVLMWGDSGSPIEFPSKAVTNWGIFADRADVFEELETAAKKWSLENDFAAVLHQRPVDKDDSTFAEIAYYEISND